MSDTVVIVAERAMPSRGGLAVATTRIAKQALARGEAVHVMVVSKDVAPGACVHRDDEGVHMHVVGRLPEEHDTLAALVEHTVDVATSVGATLVHGMYAVTAGYAATVAAARLRRSSIVSLRGNDGDRAPYRRSDLPFVSHALSRATIVTGVTRHLCSFAAGMFDRPAHFIANSVDATRFRPETRDNSLVATLGLGEDPVLGYSGELREKKGMRFLLPAFAKLLQQRPARLLLVGGVRSDAVPALHEFARVAPEAFSRVHVVEYARSPKRLSRLLALCDVMVFPSLQEGMPNAVLEAMAAARPVLATAVGGHLDILEHGRTGALLGLDALDQLPQAMAEMLDLPAEERAAMGSAARQHVLEHHHADAESAAWGRVYAEARATKAFTNALVVE